MINFKNKLIIPKTINFTKEGYENLKVKKTELEKRREETLVRLVRAREMGDLSENSAYRSSKMEIYDIDRRLRRLNYFLRFGKIADNSKISEISIGSKIVVNDGQKDLNFKIVGEYEADPLNNLISTFSPLGSSLIGKKPGDIVELNISGKKITYKVKSIL